MEYHFKNLVFEGGGVKGIAYVGALEVLEEKGILQGIKRVGGTSAGAIIALIIGLGYSNEEIKNELSKVNFEDFMDDDIGPIRDLYRLLFKGHGWFKGDSFLKWIETIIDKKTGNKDITFKEIKGNNKFKEMYFQGTNLSTHRVETFSTENIKCEDMCIKDAVRISMSIPLFFKAVQRDGFYYVDGGVLSNYPVRLFDREKYVEKNEHYFIPDYYEELIQIESDNPYVYNKETLGFRLDSKNQIDIFTGTAQPKQHKITSFFDYTWNLIGTLMENQENTHLTGDDQDRTVYVDSLDVSAIDFRIESEIKDKLIASGRASTELYFENYNAESTRSNRI